MKSRLMKITAIIGVLSACAFLAIYLLTGGFSAEKARNALGDLFLVRPALAADNATFLDQEAGMSLYFKAAGTLDLSVAKGAFKTVESQTSTYIIGSVSLPGLTDQDDVHCYVQQDGWIVVYYLKGETLIKIIDWASFSGDALTSNKLKTGLDKVCAELGLTATDTKYYDFEYPLANKWMIATDTQPDGGTNSFTVTIPSGFTVYERSWSHQAAGSSYYNIYSNFLLDGTNISKRGEGTGQGTFTSTQLAPDTTHTLTVGASYEGGYSGTCTGKIGLALVYREP